MEQHLTLQAALHCKAVSQATHASKDQVPQQLWIPVVLEQWRRRVWDIDAYQLGGDGVAQKLCCLRIAHEARKTAIYWRFLCPKRQGRRWLFQRGPTYEMVDHNLRTSVLYVNERCQDVISSGFSFLPDATRCVLRRHAKPRICMRQLDVDVAALQDSFCQIV